MDSEARVKRFRLTMIWPGFVPAVIERDMPGSPPLSGMRGELAYRELFTAARDSGARPGVPWADVNEAEFWRDYIRFNAEAPQGSVPAASASKYLIPLHEPCAPPPVVPEGWKATVHAFLYPFGPAVLIHAEHPHPGRVVHSEVGLTLPELVAACYELRGPGGSQDLESWNALARGTANRLAAMYGQRSEAEVGSPVTIATFVDVGEASAVPEDQLSKVLNALTTWPERDVWNLAETATGLPISLFPRHAIAGRLLHAAARGRAVWFPDGFQRGSLSATHRRLAFVTMQTEMLTRFAMRTAQRLPTPPSAWEDWARRAAPVLGWLYGGVLACLDSTSARAQIDSSGSLPEVNRVREYFGLDPLHVS